MMSRSQILAIISMMMLVSGCAGTSSILGNENNLWRGSLIKSDGQYWFESCIDGKRIPVKALPEEVRESHAVQSVGNDWPVYVEVIGRIEPEGLVMGQGLLVSGTPRACKYGLDGIELRGVSEREDVVFDLLENYIRVQFVDQMLVLAFERPEVEAEGFVRRWKQEMVGGGQVRHSVLLEARPKACFDKRGGWYGLSMEAELSGRYYKGCMRLGDQANWPLRQRYQTPDSMSARFIDVQLELGGVVRWREDYKNDQPLLEYEGRWERLTPGQLQLTLYEHTGSGEVALVFAIASDGTLELKNYHPAYGRSLKLEAQSKLLRFDSGDLDWWP